VHLIWEEILLKNQFGGLLSVHRGYNRYRS